MRLKGLDAPALQGVFDMTGTAGPPLVVLATPNVVEFEGVGRIGAVGPLLLELVPPGAVMFRSGTSLASGVACAGLCLIALPAGTARGGI